MLRVLPSEMANTSIYNRRHHDAGRGLHKELGAALFFNSYLFVVKRENRGRRSIERIGVCLCACVSFCPCVYVCVSLSLCVCVSV